MVDTIFGNPDLEGSEYDTEHPTELDHYYFIDRRHPDLFGVSVPVSSVSSLGLFRSPFPTRRAEKQQRLIFKISKEFVSGFDGVCPDLTELLRVNLNLPEFVQFDTNCPDLTEFIPI